MKRAMALPWLGLCLVILVECGGNDNRTSNPSATSVLTFTGVLDFARSSISLGNYTFKGGCADGDSGALTGVRFKPVTGIYSGTLGDTAVSADLTQSNLGYLHVSGTVTYTSPTCSEVFAIKESWLAGSYIQLSLTAKDGTSTGVYGRVVDSTASQLDLADLEGGCGSGGYGTLTQQ